MTRDRLYTRANWGAREFVLVDTGGLMSEAAKLPEAQQSAAMREISDRELPQVTAAVSLGRMRFMPPASSSDFRAAAAVPIGNSGAACTLVSPLAVVAILEACCQDITERRLSVFMTPCTALQAIERQAAAGIAEAKALILVVDGQTGVTSSDQEVVSWLRRTHPKKPVSPLTTRRHYGRPCVSSAIQLARQAPPSTHALACQVDARHPECHRSGCGE